MLTPHRFLAPLALSCLAGCPVWELHPSCADFDLCTSSSGSTSTTTGEPSPPTGEIATITSDGEASTSTTTAPPVSTSTGEPAMPAVVSVMFTPDPLTQVGFIEVDVAAQDADHVRMDRPGFPSVELSEGQSGHFHGSIEVLSGMSNGTHAATFVPRLEAVEGMAEIGYYTVALPEPGEEKVWDVVPDDGPGQVEALAVSGDDAIVGFGTVHEGNTARCYVYRRNLDGTPAGDPQILFAEYNCIAVDVVSHDGTIYVLAMVTGGDGPRWRLASMTWGAAPSVLATGAKDEVAHALARSANGQVLACGTAPTLEPLMDTIDGRAWLLNGPTLELDYRPPPKDAHQFDETVTDCKFRGEQLVLVGEVHGKHEEDPNNLAPPRKRPFIVELDGQGEPHWTVQGLGPGNTTQGGATALAIDDLGNAIVGLYTCGDVCDPQSELRRYKPGGAVDWQVILPAEVSMFDVAWSPAGYAVAAGALGKDLDSQFLLQGYLPGTYAPAWTFAKGKQAGLHVAFAVVAATDIIVGAGLGVGGFPAFALVYP